MNKEIINSLKAVELEHKCTVLFACESGSRAWGFASPDSDYDVRFIYVNSLDWYLKIEDTEDSINKMLPNDLDLCGWDLQKTLRLFYKCNLCLNEWLNSPIIYLKNDGFYQRLKMLIPDYFNPQKAIHHYLGTANKIADLHLQNNLVNIKKIFYVLRPIFACFWVLNKKTMPPTIFRELIIEEYLPERIIDFVNLLIAEKNLASEKDKIEIPSDVLSWLDEQRKILANKANEIIITKKIEWEPLNVIMREMVFDRYF